MPASPSGFDPFWMFPAPLSGDVKQRSTAPWFSPSLAVNYAGDPVIEDRVVTEVASYGKQLGWLTEIALALANKQPLPEKTLHDLEQASEKIEAIKNDVRPSALEAASEALDRLRRDQPELYEKLLRERQAKPKNTRLLRKGLPDCATGRLTSPTTDGSRPSSLRHDTSGSVCRHRPCVHRST